MRLRFGVTVPRTPVCPDHVPPFRAFADAYFGRNSLDPTSSIQSLALWHGSRGLSGKSFMLSLLAIVNAENHGADVNLLGGSLAQSLNIHEHVGNMLDYEEAPAEMIEERTNTRIAYSNGAKIRPLTASQKTVRGPHPPRLLLDEIDEMELKILDAALGQPMPQKNYLNRIIKPYTVMCSTWQNPRGTFTEIKRRAEERGIPTYTWCFLESANPRDGWLTNEAIEEKRASISKRMWEVEYELNEPSGGDAAFDVEKVDATFCLPHLPDPEDPEAGGYLRGKTEKDFEEFVYEEPIRGAEYAVSADWGKQRDYTVIGVGRVDVFPFRLVYYMRVNRRPYPTMIGYYNKVLRRYDAEAIHDGTGGGDVVSDYVDDKAIPFIMSGEKRDAMLTEYVSDLERGQWQIPKIPSAYTAHKYAQYGDLFARRSAIMKEAGTETAKDYHLPDEVCMMGLLNHLVRHRAPMVAPPSGLDSQPEVQTALQKQLDPPPIGRRMGEVQIVSERFDDYSLGV